MTETAPRTKHSGGGALFVGQFAEQVDGADDLSAGRTFPVVAALLCLFMQVNQLGLSAAGTGGGLLRPQPLQEGHFFFPGVKIHRILLIWSVLSSSWSAPCASTGRTPTQSTRPAG